MTRAVSTRIAGVDIGNSTTEAVLVDAGTGAVVGADRIPTAGPKGGPASLDRAARLVRRLAAAHGDGLAEVAVAPLRPVTTTTVVLPEPPADTGRLWIGTPGASTSPGIGVGRPFVVGATPPDGPPGASTSPGVGATPPAGPPGASTSPGVGATPPAGPLVAVVPDRGFRDVLGELRELAGRGVLAAVVLQRDEAVLVANRLPAGIPVVDEIPAAALADATAVAVEVRSPLRALVDPLWLAARLGLAGEERADAARVAARLYDRSSAVVAVRPAAARSRPAESAVYPSPADDLFSVDLGALADGQLARAGALASRTVVFAALRADAPYADPGPALAERLGVPVHTAPSEAAAARLGALSTPGAPPEAAVVDLGGGTIDVVTEAGARVLAGAGELLTAATAAALGIARTPAEWAKRGPSFRAEAPQLLLAEDGTRTFLAAPIRPDAIGALVVPGPAGWLPFDRRLAPGEWRALRLRLKTEILGANLTRGLPGAPAAVLVVGGPAGDDEVLGCVARALPPGTPVGRGNAAGRLGHRHAVAYGLALGLRSSRYGP